MKIAIIGTVGVPGRYGGFETLAENLVRHASGSRRVGRAMRVYCSAQAYPEQPSAFLDAELSYSRLAANGAQSVPYDVITSLHAILSGYDRLLFLGVSGACILPVLRLFSRTRIVTNVDGIEWRRNKWTGFSRQFLRWSEALAVRYSHVVIADNQGIADYLRETYGVVAEVIAYGGDHAVEVPDAEVRSDPVVQGDYYLALCRIEPENNVEMILEAFVGLASVLVFVGNWNNNDYGRTLRARFAHVPNLRLLDPVYETDRLYSIRIGASAYVHGHSAGGTNPSLVEMMHFGVPIFAFDCNFNRYSTEDRAIFFNSTAELREQIGIGLSNEIGPDLLEVARRRYRWEDISRRYLALLED